MTHDPPTTFALLRLLSEPKRYNDNNMLPPIIHNARTFRKICKYKFARYTIYFPHVAEILNS